MRAESEIMPKEIVQLNPDKVRLRIAMAGVPMKTHAIDMSEKTIQRIKKGKGTTLTTAHKLAAVLGTTVEDLLLPPAREEVEQQLPRNWLYEGVAPSGEVRQHLPAQLAIGGDDDSYIVDRLPSGWLDPLAALLEWHMQGGRKIVLRRAAHAYVIELHYFEYSPDRVQDVNYYAASACRFFALVRTGDEFRKATLSEFDADWIWSDLRRLAMEKADIVEVEGDIALVHPRDYVPVARFYRGMVMRRKLEGIRVFDQFHRDFRYALIEFLEGVDPHRVHVSTHGLGINIRIEAVRPAMYEPLWQENELCIELDLAWWTLDRRLMPAPWRLEHRKRIVNALTERNWSAVYSPGLPTGYLAENTDDKNPPLAPDPEIPTRVAEAVRALYCPAHKQWEVLVDAGT